MLERGRMGARAMVSRKVSADGLLCCEKDYREFVTFMSDHTRPSLGMPPALTITSQRHQDNPHMEMPSSTVSEQSLLYIQRCQEVALFPMIQASKLIALQTPGLLMPHTCWRPALIHVVQDHRDATVIAS